MSCLFLFLPLIGSEIAGKARMKVIFDEFDTDGSGYISASELR
jgi:Ca2+-binding EF-hand superfamily protein